MLLIFLLCLTWFWSSGQSRSTTYGVELQQYPTGFQPGLFVSFPLAELTSIDLRVGYNLVWHGSTGVHDDERGGGFGFSLGYLRSFLSPDDGLFSMGRVDGWFNRVDWRDKAAPADLMGTTDLIVIQPSFLLGYRFPLASQMSISPTLAFGWEFNVREDGEDIGEGAILLWGVRLGF